MGFGGRKIFKFVFCLFWMADDIPDCYQFINQHGQEDSLNKGPRRGIHDFFKRDLNVLALENHEGIDFNHEYIHGIDAFKNSLGRFDPFYNIPVFSQP